MTESELKYRRVLLKLGAESLAGDRSFGIDPDAVSALARRIVAAHKLEIELAIVEAAERDELLEERNDHARVVHVRFGQVGFWRSGRCD